MVNIKKIATIVLYTEELLDDAVEDPRVLVNADVEAAKASLDAAVSDHADQYAADSLKAAQDARAALDAAVKTQEAKWFKSYDKTKALAVAAKAAGDKAAADAVAEGFVLGGEQGTGDQGGGSVGGNARF